MKRCSLREYDFCVKGSAASHSRVHMHPLINCFTCSDSQLSQPPDSVVILLSSAFVSCCVCSCMINPPFLSSTTEISYRLVITTQKCAQLHRENILCAVLLENSHSIAGTKKKKGPADTPTVQGAGVLDVESAEASIQLNLKMIQDRHNRISRLCLVRM